MHPACKSHAGGFGVALVWLWVALASASAFILLPSAFAPVWLCAHFCFLLSTFCFRLASKPEAKWALLDKQVAQATSLLRQMRGTIEDIEDARTIESVKKVHGHKPRMNVSRQYQHPERRAITQPRLARHELPWEHASKATFYPERVISACAQAGGTAVVERDSDTGLLVGYAPGFPGAHSQAESLDELQANLREVIAMLLEDGEPRLEAEFVGTQSIAVA